MIRGVCTACAAIAVACGSNPELEGAARVDAVFTVPSTSVNCIRVVASGMKRSVQKDFAVTAGQSTITLEMHAIPTGTVMFSGNAYAEACGSIADTSVPSWFADDVTVTVMPGQPRSVQLNFHANGNAAVTGNFIPDAFTVSTFAGKGGVAGSVDDVGSAARFGGPIALAFDGADTLYVADGSGNRSLGMTIRKVSLGSGAVTTLAGSATELGNGDGAGGAARFTLLQSLALSADGAILYIGDSCALRSMLTSAPYTVTTLMGTRAGASWNCLTTASPVIAIISDLVLRGPGTLYVADVTRDVVARISLAATPITATVVAGMSGISGFADGAFTSAQFLGPFGLVFPSSTTDDLFVGDYGPVSAASPFGLIRKVSLSSSTVTTVAGAEHADGLVADGLGHNALFASPRRLASDGSSIFVADGSAIRRLDLPTSAVVTIAGGNHRGFADGVGSDGQFDSVSGIARNGSTLFVADEGNFAIRALTP